MKRTKYPKELMEKAHHLIRTYRDVPALVNKQIDDPERARRIMASYGALLDRASLISRLGKSYDDNRNIYEALGYNTDPEWRHFAAQYSRNPMATAVIDRPVKATWRGALNITEPGYHEDLTPFALAWGSLCSDPLYFKDALRRLDTLTSMGCYGVLLLGLDDVKDASGYMNPVKPGKRKLLYVRPLSEESAKILTFVQNPNNPRFGMPEMYNIQINTAYNSASITVQVHHTRVVHVICGKLESEIEGESELKVIYNNLQDLEKIVGGSAEMFWRGARPGYQGKVDPQFSITDEVKDDMQDELDEFENNLRRLLVTEGIEWVALAPQVADPSKHVQVQVQMISAAKGIPFRVLLGSEIGDLASTQDKANWLEAVQERREEHAEPSIVRPVVIRLIEYGILPEPTGGEFVVGWSDLWAMSDKEQAEVGRTRAEALRAYLQAGIVATAVLPPNLFLELCMGLDSDQLRRADEMRSIGITEEEIDMIERIKELEMPPVAIGPGNGDQSPNSTP